MEFRPMVVLYLLGVICSCYPDQSNNGTHGDSSSLSDDLDIPYSFLLDKSYNYEEMYDSGEQQAETGQNGTDIFPHRYNGNHSGPGFRNRTKPYGLPGAVGFQGERFSWAKFKQGFPEYSDETVDNQNETVNHLVVNTGVNLYTVSKLGKFYLTSVWMIKFIPSVYTVVFIVALPLNIMAIIIFLAKMKVRKPAVVYMLNLAVADVLFASTLPFKIIYHFSENNWIFGSVMCRFVTATFYYNMYCSILLITAISVDRFLGVVFPIQSLSWRTVRRSWVVCILIWAISIASTVSVFITEQMKNIAVLNIITCHDVVDLKRQDTFCFLFFFIPSIFTTISYIGIVRSLRSSTIGNALKRRQAVFLSLIVFCIFVICFGPTNVIFLSHYVNLLNGTVNDNLHFVSIMCVCVGSISCCLDPLLYYYVSPECQMYLYRLFCGKDGTSMSRTKALLQK